MQQRVFSTVRQFREKFPAFPEGTLRQYIFHERANGLFQYGAIVRVGRKILIEDEKFFAWLDAQNEKARKNYLAR